jgi:hypothetical protein
MAYIYVIRLTSGKYYIGKTENPRILMTNNFINESFWMQVHRPLKVIEIIPISNDNIDKELDDYTLKYMDVFGIKNVRGGSYDSILIDDLTLYKIKKRIVENKQRCSICGEPGHYENKCSHIDFSDSDDDFYDCFCEKVINNSKKDTEKDKECCFRLW